MYTELAGQIKIQEEYGGREEKLRRNIKVLKEDGKLKKGRGKTKDEYI